MKRDLKNIFDLEAVPRVLVEASAGTGKTYTIVGIYLRLLIEKDLNVDQILTVTFTKKATAELRERILERLRECLSVMEADAVPEEGDDFLNEFFKRFKNKDDVIGKLRHSIQNFDDSQVFTIHGFCQKILQEEALLAGTPFEMNVNPSDTLLETSSQDFWRVFMHKNGSEKAGQYLISKMMNIASTPAELVNSNGIRPLLEKRYAIPEGEVLDDAVKYLDSVIEKKEVCSELWRSEKQEILKILRNCDVSRYQTHLDTRVDALEEFFEDSRFTEDEPKNFNYFTSDYLYDESKLKKSGSPVTRHPFFDVCSEYKECIGDINKVETTLIKHAYEDIISRRDNLSKTSDSYSYNDLLIKIRDSLADENGGQHLAVKLKERFPVALVDEFQDTDPIQYEIFSTIYPGSDTESSLMMIGDPKQAIYAFRGADLHTYFRARKEGVDAEYTLKRNYRSTVQYIEAINSLFGGDHQSFIEEEIEFIDSLPGRDDHRSHLTIEGEGQAPVQVVARHGVESSKDRACDFSFRQTVNRISHLLNSSAEGKAHLGKDPVKAGDIAILVSRNKDAFDLQQRLKKAGIDAVTKTDQSIFNTLESRKIEMLMNAVLNPTDHKILNAALLTGIFGFELNDLFDVKEDEDRRQKLVEELTGLLETWKKYGFYAMFYRILYNDNRLVHFTGVNGAERIITNLFHLADLCAKAENDDQLGPAKLHTWLLRQMEDSDEDEKELQLESDSHLVKIMTIHSSKGLQFPIVFCPTLWMGYTPSSFESKVKKMVEYHKEESDDLIINIDREKTEQRRIAERASDIESISEDVRKTYVALTRAQYASVIIWESHTNSNVSGLGASLIGRQTVIESIENKLKVDDKNGYSDKEFIDRFRELKKQTRGRIQLQMVSGEESEEEALTIEKKQDSELPFQTYAGREQLRVQKRLESFTSLAGHSSEPGVPDHDQLIGNYSAPFEESPEDRRPNEWSIFTFPKGATAGTAIHKLFEHNSFEFSRAKTTDHTEAIEEILEDYRFDKKWTPILQEMMRNVAASNIPDLTLSNISQNDELREMEFHFPSSSADGAALLQIIRGDGKPVSANDNLHRYMTGFIDLVVRQNAKYMILDYKSNYLGDIPEDYSTDLLGEEIRAASYDLQYHLYTVALVKYLKSKIDGFDYDTHFGGVAYLFVRGMKAGSDNGIWYHKPEKEVIEHLGEILNRTS